MRLLLPLLLLCLLPANALSQSATAFVGVDVIPMDAERVIENQTVLVQGDRIVSIGSRDSFELPADAIIVQGDGHFVLPGLAEMHGHIPPPTQPREEIENTLFLYLANGITTVRGMLGWPGQLELREEANTGRVDSPTLYLAGPSFNNNTVSSPEQAALRVEQQVEEGWDLLKIHPGLTLAEYDAVAAKANELGIRFGGHVPADVGLPRALDAGQETFDHLDGYVEYLSSVDNGDISKAALDGVVEMTLDADAWVVPTMVLWETLYAYPTLESLQGFPELKYVSNKTVEAWSNAFRQRLSNPSLTPAVSAQVIGARMQVLEALSDAGANILMGTDAPQQFSVPGFSLHREIERMSEAGMTPYDVLYSGTTAVGQYFSDQDSFGIIAPGQRADLILLKENPLEDLGNLEQRAGVMVRGIWYPEEVIQRRLQEIESYYE